MFFLGLVGCNDSAFRQERFSRSQNRVAQDVHVMSTSCRHFDISKHFDQEIGEQRVQIVHTESGCLTAPSATSFVRTRLDQNVRMSEHVRTDSDAEKPRSKNVSNVSPWTEKIRKRSASRAPRAPRGHGRQGGLPRILTLSSRCPHVVSLFGCPVVFDPS